MTDLGLTVCRSKDTTFSAYLNYFLYLWTLKNTSPKTTSMESPYQKDVIDFVTVSVQTCLLLEHVAELEKDDFVEKLLIYLPLLYVKTRALGKAETNSEGSNPTCVTEEDYNFISEGVRQIMGDDDAYLEVFMQDMQYSDRPITAFLSENIADIYQELKNMAFNYQQENTAVMLEAVNTCIETFYEYWGQKLLNALRALHNINNQNR